MDIRTAESVALIKRLEAHARDIYINRLGNDPVDIGIEYFVEGFIEGVFAQQEEGLL
jgi:hypothetical protein